MSLGILIPVWILWGWYAFTHPGDQLSDPHLAIFFFFTSIILVPTILILGPTTMNGGPAVGITAINIAGKDAFPNANPLKRMGYQFLVLFIAAVLFGILLFGLWIYHTVTGVPI